MVRPVSSVGRCTAVVSPSKAAANINALAWTGLWAACPYVAWTSACPALTAPSQEELSCLENVVRNGCVMSPRTAPWLALPWLVSSHPLRLSPTSGPGPSSPSEGENCPIWVFYLVFMHPALTAYRLEDTFGPDPTMMRANCLVQTTEWSACSKTCGMGISTRVTNDNAFCRLEKQSRLCMVRPCEADLEENIKVHILPSVPHFLGMIMKRS